MIIQIRPFNKSDMNDLITLTLLAFEPIFESFEKILGPHIYAIIYPDWRKRQKEGVEKISQDSKISLLIAEVDEKVVGYIAMKSMMMIQRKFNYSQSILNTRTMGSAHS